MDNKNFRATKNRIEILKLLSTKFAEIGNFTLWQKNDKTNKRTITTQVKFDTLNIKYNFFSVVLTDQDLISLNKDLDTYFLLKEYDFVFKTKLISVSPSDPHILLFKIPKDIHLKELRKESRRILDLVERTTINVVFIDKNNLQPLHTVCPIINISSSGICLMVSNETMKKINIEKEVFLQPISFLPELKKPTDAIIRNIRVFSKKNFIRDEVFAIGLKFISHVDLEVQK